MNKLVRFFKWLFARFLVKDVVYTTKARTDKPEVSSRRNYQTRIMTRNERILYKHYPNLQKWYNHFNGAIPDKLPVLNFRPK